MAPVDQVFETLLRGIVSRSLRLRYRRYLDIRGRLSIGARVRIRAFSPDRGNRPTFRIVAHGQNTIGSGTVLQGSATLTLGENSYLGDYCVIGCNDSVSIGRDVMIAQAVTIRDTDHATARTEIPMNKQGITTAPVSIGDDVWIAHGAVILKGVTIGTGAIVAAGAVVNRDVAPFDIVGGVPARRIASRRDARLEEGKASP